MKLVAPVAVALLVAVVAGAFLDPRRAHRARTTRHRDHPGPRSEGPPSRPLAFWRRRRSTLGPAAPAAWADDIARSLRHGSTLRATLLAVLPDDALLRARTEPLRHRLERGATVADAADEWAEQLDGRAAGGRLLVALAAVIGATAQLGGSAAVPLERFAITMREHVSDELERHAQSAQAKMSARVLTMVPIAMLTVLVVTDADVRHVLTTPSGGGAVAIGLALNAAGAGWMRRIAGPTSSGLR